MSATDLPPAEPFRPSQLLYDTRYRSYTIQIFALIVVMLVFAWAVDNAIRNLEALGKDFRFSFLFETSAYDINQHLIDYDSTSTHGRAAIVGILNTILVAIMGCITATVIGVVAGAPPLAQLDRLPADDGLCRGLPQHPGADLDPAHRRRHQRGAAGIRAFRGADAAGGWLFGSVFFTNRGFYIPAPVFEAGSAVTVAVLALSIAGAWAFVRWAKARQAATGRILPTFWIGLAILALPMLAAFFATGRPVSLEIPALKGFNFQGGLYMRDSLIGLWLALSVYTGAFIAENVRAGILAISKGQTEAAYALGLRPRRTMSLVVLPQALRVIVPPLISQYLNLTKNSSLAIAVGYMDVTGTLGGITLNQTGREMECILLLMAFYLAASLTISACMNAYNSRVRLRER